MGNISKSAHYIETENPLLINTAFSGTRQEPEKRGSISNIDINNLTMPNLCDGVMNGMVGELYDFYQQMIPLLRTIPSKMVGSGNGIRLNNHLAKRFAKTFEMPINIPIHKEEAAFGSTLFGLTVAKGFTDMKETQQLIHYL